MHSLGIIHRDLKPSNIFLSSCGKIKIGDLGMARTMTYLEEPMTNNVVTRWYRSPELLLGATNYGPAVDIWSWGCIFAEVMVRAPLFPAENDINVLFKIFEVCLIKQYLSN